MQVNWGDLGTVVGVSLGITVLVVVMFSLGITAWARAGAGGLRAGVHRSGPERVAAGTAMACFAVCLAVAAYGIDLIVPD